MGNNIADLAELLEPTGEDDKVEINEETGLVVKPKETDDDPSKSTKTPEEKPATDVKTKEGDEPTVTDTKTEGPKKKEDGAKPLEQTAEEQNRELKQILRQQSKDMRIMQSKLERLEKRSVTATKKAEESADDVLFGKEGDKTKEDPIELSEIEVAQNDLAALAKEKSTVLETLLEVMEMNPKYADVRTVCSQNNFSDMFAAVGEALAEKEGADPTVAAMQAEVAIWKMPNPYKYMYDLIKKYHPSYIVKGTLTKEKEKELPTKTPTSLANVPGKTEGDNKWTSARIDEMPEEELHLVPEDIYNKYLEGGLD